MIRDDIAAINRHAKKIARIAEELRTESLTTQLAAILARNAEREEQRALAELEYHSYRYSRMLGACASVLASPYGFGDRAVAHEARYNAERNRALALAKGWAA